MPQTGVDIFIKIKGKKQGYIRGESIDEKHPNEIQASWFTWEATAPYDMSGSGMASGRRQYGAFKFRTFSQSSTPGLLTALSTNETLDVTVTCRKAGKEQQEYMIWTLGTCNVHKVLTGYILAGEVSPNDEIWLIFRDISLTYRVQASAGIVGGDLVFSDQWSTPTG